MTLEELKCLAAVADGAAFPADIQQRTGLTMQQVNTAVALLAYDGMIRCRFDDHCSMTDTGQAVYADKRKLLV